MADERLAGGHMGASELRCSADICYRDAAGRYRVACCRSQPCTLSDAPCTSHETCIGHFGTFNNARRIANNRDIPNSLREMFEPCGKGAVRAGQGSSGNDPGGTEGQRVSTVTAMRNGRDYVDRPRCDSFSHRPVKPSPEIRIWPSRWRGLSMVLGDAT
jgi:hypothetical protein